MWKMALKTASPVMVASILGVFSAVVNNHGFMWIDALLIIVLPLIAVLAVYAWMRIVLWTEIRHREREFSTVIQVGGRLNNVGRIVINPDGTCV